MISSPPLLLLLLVSLTLSLSLLSPLLSQSITVTYFMDGVCQNPVTTAPFSATLFAASETVLSMNQNIPNNFVVGTRDPLGNVNQVLPACENNPSGGALPTGAGSIRAGCSTPQQQGSLTTFVFDAYSDGSCTSSVMAQYTNQNTATNSNCLTVSMGTALGGVISMSMVCNDGMRVMMNNGMGMMVMMIISLGMMINRKWMM